MNRVRHRRRFTMEAAPLRPHRCSRTAPSLEVHRGMGATATAQELGVGARHLAAEEGGRGSLAYGLRRIPRLACDLGNSKQRPRAEEAVHVSLEAAEMWRRRQGSPSARLSAALDLAASSEEVFWRLRRSASGTTSSEAEAAARRSPRCGIIRENHGSRVSGIRKDTASN